MDEFDDPIQFELRTERELATLMFAIGLGAASLQQDNRIKGAAALSNLQVRVVNDDAEKVSDALDQYSIGGFLNEEGPMSTSAAVSKMAEEEEVDPEEVTKGGL